MIEKIPEAFVDRMRKQLGNELSAFLRALDEPPVRGIRLNPLKPCPAALEYAGEERIPWTEDGYYLACDSRAGSTVLHAAGAFYIQEPGAMMPAAVLNAKPGEKILDLCAAPGGKSTQIGCSMKGKGLLVCNEPLPKRAMILSGNIERMGLPNTVVTCEWPEKLAKQWPESFDAVLADAPCSGEGMFRRDPATRMEWSAEKAQGCAERQRNILSAAARLVRPGGRLVYSTCTYNPAENEENIRWFTDQYPEFTTEAFSLPGVSAHNGMYTCYPHRLQGEGQFTALLRRTGNRIALMRADNLTPRPSMQEFVAVNNAFPSLPYITHRFGQTLIHAPELPDIKGIRVLRAGLHIGEIRGNAVVPDHAAAMYFAISAIQIRDMKADEVKDYVSGLTIPGDMDGWTLMRYKGQNVGWGKGTAGMIKNHYPKGLRNPKLIL